MAFAVAFGPLQEAAHAHFVARIARFIFQGDRMVAFMGIEANTANVGHHFCRIVQEDMFCLG
jgi:hypothetical protein